MQTTGFTKKLRSFFHVIFLVLIGLNVARCSKDDPIVIPPNPPIDEPVVTPTDFAFGVDLSYVKQIEDHGGIYKEAGVEVDPYAIMKNHGANVVRLRLWHNPTWVRDVYNNPSVTLYSGFEEVATNIARAHALGMQVNLDIHYSDTWADPEHQEPPAAWTNITDVSVLVDSVYNYTYNVLSILNQRGILPEMVQIGNESNPGFMATNTPSTFPQLSVYKGNWVNMGKVINAGIKAVRDVDVLAKTTTTVALHVADPKNLEWWFTDIMAKGKVTDFDVAGFSYYPIKWHTTISFEALPALVTLVKNKINKKVMILETAYPYTAQANDGYNNLFGSQDPLVNYPFTVAGQKKFMTDLSQSMMTAGASGVMYWEPGFITSQMKDLWGQGSSWENCTFFGFDGNVTDAINYMKATYVK